MMPRLKNYGSPSRMSWYLGMEAFLVDRLVADMETRRALTGTSNAIARGKTKIDYG